MTTRSYQELEAELQKLKSGGGSGIAQVAYDQLFGHGAYVAAATTPDPEAYRAKMLEAKGEERASALRSFADVAVKTEADARVKAAEDAVKIIEAQLADRDAQITGLRADVARLTGEAQSVERRAVDLVAQVNHKPALIDPSHTGDEGKAVKQFLAIKDPKERGAFYEAHLSEIEAELRTGSPNQPK